LPDILTQTPDENLSSDWVRTALAGRRLAALSISERLLSGVDRSVSGAILLISMWPQ